MLKCAQRICVSTLIAGGLFAQTTLPVQETKTTGAVGIAEGQTGRFNVLNAGVPAMAAPGVVCSAVLTYYNGQGAALKSKTVSVPLGQIASLDLFSDADLALPADQRAQIRATVTVPAIAPPSTSSTASSTSVPIPVCRLIGTLEIFDTLSGRTKVVLGATHLVPAIAATPAAQ